MSDDEARLIQLAQRGDAGACATLYNRHYDTVYRYCYYRVKDADLAQDLASELFVRMVQSLGTFRGRGRPLLAWLYTIARNLVTDVHRQKARAFHLPLGEAAQLSVDGQGDLAHIVDRRLQANCLRPPYAT
jgi:RNA polymerase sigma-70 factor (ECF subfamily)